MRKCGFSRLRLACLPRMLYTFCSDLSRMLQVLYTSTSASSASMVDEYPIDSRLPAMRSASLEFIWQPNTCM